MVWIILCMRGILMGSLFSRPKPPSPPSTDALTAREKQLEAEALRESRIAQGNRKANQGGMSSIMMAGGQARPDYLDPPKTKLCTSVRNPRG